MQVKKFEAKTMQEALRLVKQELGPEAIILAARDNRKAFGLLSQPSVEVTAAISDTVLRKKKFVESRLDDKSRNRFSQTSARAQRELIEKVVDRYANQQTAEEQRRITQMPYIAISDEDEAAAAKPEPALERIRDAAKAASQAGMESLWETPKPVRAPAQAAPIRNTNPAGTAGASAPVSVGARAPEVEELKNEIRRLQEVIQSFRQMPQSFVTPHPGAQFGVPYEMNFMFEKLHGVGIEPDLIVEILQSARTSLSLEQVKKRPLVDAYVARWILDHVKVVENPYQGRVHLFVGPSGSGKTSALVKMASHLVVAKRKRLAIVTTDSFKVGAADQLKIFCKILNVPFVVLRDQTQWKEVFTALSGVDHILVDFPGLALRELKEIDTIRSLIPRGSENPACHLVLPVTAKDRDCYEFGQRFKIAQYQDVIFTHLDQSIQHGVILNFQRKYPVPLHSFGVGPNIPEDFEIATKERVLDLLFKLTKIKNERGQE